MTSPHGRMILLLTTILGVQTVIHLVMEREQARLERENNQILRSIAQETKYRTAIAIEARNCAERATALCQIISEKLEASTNGSNGS